jgi:hypothetical protein
MSEVNGNTFVLKVKEVDEVDELFLRNSVTLCQRAVDTGLF